MTANPVQTPVYYGSPAVSYQQPQPAVMYQVPPQPQQIVYQTQPQQNQQNQQSQQLNSIVLLKVPSLDYVKNCQTPAGMFMHSTRPYMFIKSAPTSPIESPEIAIYKLTKVDNISDDLQDDLSEHTGEYVTRKEYMELKESIASIEERMNSDESIYRSAKKKWTNDVNSGPDRNRDTNPNRDKSGNKPNGRNESR